MVVPIEAGGCTKVFNIKYLLKTDKVAFYISKNWKKADENEERTGKPRQSSKAKEEFQAQAREIRGKLSKAKAEIERVKSN